YTVPSGYEYPVFSLSDSVTVEKGAHSFNFGFQGYREQDHYYDPTVGFPQTNFGLASGDPAVNAFTLPNAQGVGGTLPFGTASAQSEAWQLYAVLAGRISSVAGRNGYNGQSYGPQSVHLDEVALATGIWAQDSWKLLPNLTMNYGLRWDFIVDPHDIKSQYH